MSGFENKEISQEAVRLIRTVSRNPNTEQKIRNLIANYRIDCAFTEAKSSNSKLKTQINSMSSATEKLYKNLMQAPEEFEDMANSLLSRLENPDAPINEFASFSRELASKLNLLRPILDHAKRIIEQQERTPKPGKDLQYRLLSDVYQLLHPLTTKKSSQRHEATLMLCRKILVAALDEGDQPTLELSEDFQTLSEGITNYEERRRQREQKDPSNHRNKKK